MKFAQFFLIALLLACVSAEDKGRASLLTTSKELPIVLANINNQMAALQALVAANTNALSTSSGSVTNLNNQLIAALATANSVSNSTTATAQRLNNLITVLKNGASAISAAVNAVPITALVGPAATMVSQLSAF